MILRFTRRSCRSAKTRLRSARSTRLSPVTSPSRFAEVGQHEVQIGEVDDVVAGGVSVARLRVRAEGGKQ